MAELEGAVLVFTSDVDGTPGVKVIVVHRRGAYIVWEADGELATGIFVSKEDIGEGIAALLRGVELLNERGRLLRDPCLGDGLARGEDDDGGLAGVDDGLDKVGHGADEVEVRDVDVLASGGVEAFPELVLVARPGTDDDYSDVCGCSGCSGGDSSGETGLITGPTLAALGEGGG